MNRIERTRRRAVLERQYAVIERREAAEHGDTREAHLRAARVHEQTALLYDAIVDGFDSPRR